MHEHKNTYKVLIALLSGEKHQAMLVKETGVTGVHLQRIGASLVNEGLISFVPSQTLPARKCWKLTDKGRKLALLNRQIEAERLKP